MHHLFKTIALSVSLASSAFAFDLEKNMYLSQHVLSYTTSYDVSSRDRKLGTLYRRVLSLNTKYDFYDTKHKMIASAQSHFFSFRAHFDIYDDTQQNILGTVEERVFSFFPSFDLYGKDGTHLGRAKMNFWGTKFTLYDGMSSTKELAVMSRNFFRLKHNWIINIKDLDRVKEKNIDSRLLMTVLAVQGDIEYLERRRQRDRDTGDHRLQARSLAASSPLVQRIQNKLSDFINQEENLATATPLAEQALSALATHMEEGYQQQYANTNLSEEQKTEQFVDYCLNVARASDTNLKDKKAIADLLQKRMQE